MPRAACPQAYRQRRAARCGGAPSPDHRSRPAAADRLADPARAVADRSQCHPLAQLRHRSGARSCPPPRHRSARSALAHCAHAARSKARGAAAPHAASRLALVPEDAGPALPGHCTISRPSYRPAGRPGLRAASAAPPQARRQCYSTTPAAPVWPLRQPSPRPGHHRPTIANRGTSAPPTGHVRQSHCHRTQTAPRPRRSPRPAAPRFRWANRPAPPAGTGWRSRPWPPPPVGADRGCARPGRKLRRYHHRRQNRAAGGRAAATTGALPCHTPRHPRPASVPANRRAGWHGRPVDRPSARADRATQSCRRARYGAHRHRPASCRWESFQQWPARSVQDRPRPGQSR